MLHLATHTGSQFLHAAVRDGGLGVPQLRRTIPDILCRRLDGLTASDYVSEALLKTKGFARDFHRRMRVLAGGGPSDAFWREEITTRPFSAGLEAAVEDLASRAWLAATPRGWTGGDFVRAVQLRTGNLPTKGLASVNPQERRCRAGCQRTESLSHVLQGCPVTHALRLKRHDEIVSKIATHSRRRGYTVEKEPRVYHPDRQLFVPDLAIQLPGEALRVCDVQVCWEGARNLMESWERKRLVYDNARFRAAAARRWPQKRLTILPLLLGARGIWPSCNARVAELLALPKTTKASCVHSCLKWDSTLHRHFMASVWRQSNAGERVRRQPPATIQPPRRRRK
ncbi:hypothetical protein QE152_g5694 [Popillia japonica]|uniref:Reverse transcriptase n=1 Tax=Popillia japonica TaxID=7064 RepID=A0AAW1MMA0_POPJA